MGEEAAFVRLQDGRRIAYQEMGCTRQSATRSLLVLHGAFSSRFFAMPGVSQGLLKEYEVRLVAIDRPGYGESDPNPSQTLQAFTQDVVEVKEKLQMGAHIWLLGYSLGCIYCWAAARYIPHHLAGVFLWAPAPNFEWQIFTSEEMKAIKAGFSWKALRQLYFLSKKLPFASFRQQVGALCKQIEDRGYTLDAFQKGLSLSDKQALDHSHILEFVLRDRQKSVGGWTNGFGLAKDFHLLTSPWGFELEEIGRTYQGVIHIWQGEEDTAVPLLLQEIISRKAPRIILHKLEGEGHFSAFYFNERAHRSTLDKLSTENGYPRARI